MLDLIYCISLMIIFLAKFDQKPGTLAMIVLIRTVNIMTAIGEKPPSVGASEGPPIKTCFTLLM